MTIWELMQKLTVYPPNTKVKISVSEEAVEKDSMINAEADIEKMYYKTDGVLYLMGECEDTFFL